MHPAGQGLSGETPSFCSWAEHSQSFSLYARSAVQNPIAKPDRVGVSTHLSPFLQCPSCASPSIDHRNATKISAQTW